MIYDRHLIRKQNYWIRQRTKVTGIKKITLLAWDYAGHVTRTTGIWWISNIVWRQWEGMSGD